MGGAGLGRAGRFALGLLILNGLVLVVGLTVEHWLATPRSLPEFNAEMIRPLAHPDGKKAAKPLAPPAEPAPPPRACLRVERLDQNRYAEVAAALQAQGVTPEQREFLLGKSLGWWVFWPPEYEAAQRDKALKAIRAVGLKDVMPISRGPLAQAFSLGMFASESQALAQRDRLRGKGLDKVELGPRPGQEEAHILCNLASPEHLAKLRSNLPPGLAEVEMESCRGPEAAPG